MLPVKIKAKSFKKPRMKLTIAADKEDMLPFLSKLKIYLKKKFQGLRDEVPNVLRFLNEIEKRLSAPSNF